ncbi:MAG TPA: phosphoribosyltransferase [Chloroflexota bacterium]|nr:phosphoribosyltransferase [Chloroflexota bacterium]
MIDLDFWSYAAVHRRVIETIPQIRQFPIDAVTYIPRGGSAIAAIVCQILDVPLLASIDEPRTDPTRVLLVDDMIVSGRSLADFRHRFPQRLAGVPTYVFASVPQDRPDDTAVDIVSITVDPRRYFLLPWEIGDIFRPTFPFSTLVEIDGVIRSPRPPERAILSTSHEIPHLLSFGHDEAGDRRWLTSHGYRCHRLTSLPNPADAKRLADLIRDNGIRFYLGSDARRGAILKQICPTCHVVVFPGMVEI